MLNFDVIVVGGGHAGCEAALASARLGAKTLLLTINNDHIAQMSCNPAIGGIAKGQVVREIDALGGEMGRNADATSIMFRMLNESKGAAALSPRAQCDRALYQRRMKLVLERQENLFIHQCEVTELVVRKGMVCGVKTCFGDTFLSKAVVLCTGTFLNGKLHFGLKSRPGGRCGDSPATHLTDCLVKKLGLEVGRLKTGTPVRVLGRSMDTSAFIRQDSDPGTTGFTFGTLDKSLPVFGRLKMTPMPCYMTYSTEKTAEVVRANLSRSPMYSGKIHGTGARYCPSFEDKIVRFADRPRHHIYIEPEGESTDEYYLNGISTSMPVDVQWQMIRSLPGLENAFITRYAYAIEYDFVYPHQLDTSLAVKNWPSLFHAGQINGTSGYEEAAAQGLIAGINAARFAGNLGPALRLGRDQAYIGVMIDDLVTKEIVEPYRLFTSRAEYRLSLRQDNADRRLTKIGYDVGLATKSSYDKVKRLERELAAAKETLKGVHVPGGNAWEMLSHPDFNYRDHLDILPAYSPRVWEQLEIDARYSGYIEHQASYAKSMQKLENCRIPVDFDYDIPGISTEAKIKLQKKRPETLGQASRIDGVTPAEIAVLQVKIRN